MADGSCWWLCVWLVMLLLLLHQKWQSEGVVYVVPRGELDDLYWMYATTVPPPPPPASSTASSGAAGPVGTASSMMLAVSNDCLRDHWVGLLQARAFQRWRDSQVGREHAPPSLPCMHSFHGYHSLLTRRRLLLLCVRGCCGQVSSFHMHYNEEGNVTHATFRYHHTTSPGPAAFLPVWPDLVAPLVPVPAWFVACVRPSLSL